MKRQIVNALMIALVVVCAVVSQYEVHPNIPLYMQGCQTSFNGAQPQLMADPGGATGGNGGG